MRTNASQLPSYQELKEILASEAQRKVPAEKEDEHYGDFTTILELLDSFSIQNSFFTEKIAFEDMDNTSFFNEVIKMFDDLIRNILKSQDDPKKQLLFNNLYDYLSKEDGPENADLIFVFGSKATFRTEKAISLYKKNYAYKILISGRGPFYEKEEGKASEAENLGKFAVEHGIPKTSLILETKAITVPDNVKRSLNMLEKEKIPHKSIVLVNSPFSQRRGWAHFKKFSDVDTTLIRVNVDKVSDTFSRDGWYRNETGAKIIMKEFFGLRVSELLNSS